MFSMVKSLGNFVGMTVIIVDYTYRRTSNMFSSVDTPLPRVRTVRYPQCVEGVRVRFVIDKGGSRRKRRVRDI